MRIPAGRWILALGTVLVVMFVLYSGYRVIDDRNQRREAASAAVAESNARVAANAARIQVLGDITVRNCRALNVDAGRLNKILDYFELYAKTRNPSPGTDAFFAGLPRPTVVRCTPKRSHAP